MAKRDGAKKAGKTKLPKRVGGVKLPKQLRKSASIMADIAQNPIARDVVSAALVAGAAALARGKAKEKPASGAPKKAEGEFANLIAQGQEIGTMISDGINAFVGALLKPAVRPGAAPHAAASTKRPAANPAARRTAPKKPVAAKHMAQPASAKPATTTREPAKQRAKPGPKPKPAS